MSRRSLALPVLLALTLPARPAAGEWLVSAGAGRSIPTGAGESRRFGAGATIGYGLPLPAPDLVGLKVRRFHYDGLEHTTTSLSGFYRLSFAESSATRFFFSLSLGFGAYTGCVEDGHCDGLGLAASAELGVSVAVASRLRLEAAFEPAVQFGMPSRVGQLFLPSLQVGISY